jgi:uncharacterized membrane protein YeiH
MDWHSLDRVLAMAATVAFAVTAVMAVRGDRDVDLFGATVLGLITAVGGGTIRDVILDVPVFWATDLSYVWWAVAASVSAIYARRLFATRHLNSLMEYLDGFGAAMFGIQATGKVWDLGFAVPAGPVMLGVITAIGGGLIRDTLAGRTTLLMRPELYAIPVMLGCILFTVVLAYLPEYRVSGALLCILLTFGLRAAAIHWNLKVPGWMTVSTATGAAAVAQDEAVGE